MKIRDRVSIASNCVDGAWLLFDERVLPLSELNELPPEVLEFKALIDRARELSYGILDEYDRASCKEYLTLHLVD